MTSFQVIKVHPEILQQMLSTVLNIIMFEDCRNQWSMSRCQPQQTFFFFVTTGEAN